MSSIFMRFPNGKPRALTLSYDDGVEQDIRLISVLQQYGINRTFNLNSRLYAPEGHAYLAQEIHRRMTKQRATALYTQTQMEVAVHGLTHPFLEQLPLALAVREVLLDRQNLEQQFSTIVRGMAYPFGTYSDALVQALKSCGIAYARTVESSHSFQLPQDWLRLKPTCHHDDPALMELLDAFLSARIDRAPHMFYLWGHSYEFEANDNWHVIENFSKKAGGHDDVWYATNIELAQYVAAYNSLQFSADGDRVFNPSATCIWFLMHDTLVSIPAGESRLLVGMGASAEG